MNLALEIFNKLHVLTKEISDIKDVKYNIVNTLDDIMENIDEINMDLLCEKKINKKLIRFKKWKDEKAKYIWMLLKILKESLLIDQKMR